MSNTPESIFEAMDEAENRIVRAVRRAVRRFLGRAVTMDTLGEMYGWWGEQVDPTVTDSIRETWFASYQTYAEGVISGSSLNGLEVYVSKVRDRLVRGVDPPLPQHAFDLVRQALILGAANGWSSEAVGQQIAASLGWEKESDYWREQKTLATDRIDSILDKLGEPGNPAREWARLNDPQVQVLRDQSNLATRHLDAERSYWQDRAIKIARTESTGAFNAAALHALHDEGWKFKEWLATRDTRTRESHRGADGQTVALASPFRVGTALLQMPGDPTGRADEVINCRCAILGSDGEGLTAAAGHDVTTQARVPKGNGRLSGRWIDMPGSVFEVLHAMFDGMTMLEPVITKAEEQVLGLEGKDLWTDPQRRVPAAANILASYDTGTPEDMAILKEAVGKLRDFSNVDWYSDPDFDPMKQVAKGTQIPTEVVKDPDLPYELNQRDRFKVAQDPKTPFPDKFQVLSDLGDQLISGLKMDPEYRKHAKASMGKVVRAVSSDSSEVAVAVSSTNVNKILKAGRLKNMWETHKNFKGKISESDPYVRSRTFFENSLLGVPEETPDEKRPIYGYIHNPRSMAFPEDIFYGDVQMILKPAVKNRTTVSFGDSLNNMTNPILYTDLKKASPEQLLRAWTVDFMGLEVPPEDYVEAEIHGGVTLEDIDRVEINLKRGEAAWDPDAQERLRLVGKKLEKAGVHVVYR